MPDIAPAAHATLLRLEQISERTTIPIETLRHWRKIGTGPPMFRIGRRVVCTEADLAAWIESLRNGAATGA